MPRTVTALAVLLPSLSACAGLADLPVVSGLLQPDVQQDRTALRAGDYRLDPAHAALTFRVDHMGLSAFTGRFETLEASLDFDEASPQAASLDVIIDMTSLDIANEEFRTTLLGPDWFDAGTYPQARFVSTGIEVTGEAAGRVSGDLTLRGETRPVTLDVTFNGGAQVPLTRTYTLGFDAVGEIARAEFGMGRFSGFVGETVTIRFSGEFQQQ